MAKTPPSQAKIESIGDRLSIYLFAGLLTSTSSLFISVFGSVNSCKETYPSTLLAI